MFFTRQAGDHPVEAGRDTPRSRPGGWRLATMSRPALPRSPAPMAPTNPEDPGVPGDDVAARRRSTSSPRTGTRSRGGGGERPDQRGRGLALRPAPACSPTRPGAGLPESTTTTSTCSGSPDGVTVQRLVQSISTVRLSTPASDELVHHAAGDTEARCSARWQRWRPGGRAPHADREGGGDPSARSTTAPCPWQGGARTADEAVVGRDSATTPATWRAPGGVHAAGSATSSSTSAGSSSRSTRARPGAATPAGDGDAHLAPPWQHQAARVVGVVADEVHRPGAWARWSPWSLPGPASARRARARHVPSAGPTLLVGRAWRPAWPPRRRRGRLG